MKRILLLCILGLVLLAGLQACDLSIGTTSSSTPTPSATSATRPATSAITTTTQPTPTATSSAMASDLTSIITAYYNLIEIKNYAQAYTYLDAKATNSTSGQTLTQSSFIQLAQQMDSEEGTIVTFDIGVFPPSPDVIMTITRSSIGPYHTHLTMQQEDNTWKIMSLDRI